MLLISRSLSRALLPFAAAMAAVLPLLPANAGEPTAILVDKKTNKLHVVKYVDGKYDLIKTFHATIGQVKGDKVVEGDLKTPEGIYTFTSRLKPPAIKPKFGVMAFYMNYPNPFDEIAGRTGFDIMLHATDEPERLSKNFDSEGCIVVKNEEIDEIGKYIRLGLTPIVVYPELKQEHWHPGSHERITSFFNNWIKAWESQDIEAYINHYHSEFSAQGKDVEDWRKYKRWLTTRYETIQVKPENVQFHIHPKYSVAIFTQNYRSTYKSGRSAHQSRGTKLLYIAEEKGEPKIVAEHFTTLMW